MTNASYHSDIHQVANHQQQSKHRGDIRCHTQIQRKSMRHHLQAIRQTDITHQFVLNENKE